MTFKGRGGGLNFWDTFGWIIKEPNKMSIIFYMSYFTHCVGKF